MSGKEPFKTVCFLISADLFFDNIRFAHEMFTNQRDLEVIGYCFFIRYAVQWRKLCRSFGKVQYMNTKGRPYERIC